MDRETQRYFILIILCQSALLIEGIYLKVIVYYHKTSSQALLIPCPIRRPPLKHHLPNFIAFQ